MDITKEGRTASLVVRLGSISVVNSDSEIRINSLYRSAIQVVLVLESGDNGFGTFSTMKLYISRGTLVRALQRTIASCQQLYN